MGRKPALEGGGWHLMQAEKRHLPRLDACGRPRRGGPRLLRAPAQGLEILRADRADDPLRHGDLRSNVRVGPRPGPRPLRRPHRPGRLPRRLRQIRPGDRRLRREIRRPERTRLRRTPGRRQRRPSPDDHRHLRRHTTRKRKRHMADIAEDLDPAHAASLGRRYLEDTLRSRPLWIRLIIEFLGTFILVTVAAGAGVINHYAGGNPISRTAAVIAPGAVVMAMIYAWGPLSGLHINPR